MHLAGTGEERPGARPHGAGRQVGPHVEAEDPIRSIALEDPGLAHALGAARGLLCRLEDEEHVPRERDPRPDGPIDQHGRRERHGHVAVVPARVHAARMLRGEGHARPLADGQRVHVGAHGHGGSRLATMAQVEERAHTPLAGIPHLAGEQAQHALHIRDGLRQLIVQLGNPMKVAPEPREQLQLRGRLEPIPIPFLPSHKSRPFRKGWIRRRVPQASVPAATACGAPPRGPSCCPCARRAA